MKSLLSTLTIITFLTATAAYATTHAETACEDRIDVTVDGLVCDFCARALEKVFGKRDDVATIKVDLDHAEVMVGMKSGQTMDDATLTQLITDSGYNIRSIERGCDD